MSEDVQLSAQQTEKLLQFHDLSGIDDMARCREILQAHNWDIEIAVQDTLNMQEGPMRPSPYNPPLMYNTSPLVVQSPNQRIYSAVRPWQPQGFIGWSFYLLSSPFSFMLSFLMNLVRFTLSFVRPDPRRSTASDPLSDVMSFIEQYEGSYGRNHPIFYQGIYSQVLNDAKQELKFVLVYLHCDEHQDTPAFCRNTLGDGDVINFINSNTLFWACSVQLPEGYRVSQTLRETTYPFLAVIVLRDNRMTLVARLEGPLQPEELIHKIQTIINDNEGALIAARMDRQERSLNQSIRQQQDEAYYESLRVDQEKERRRKEEREQKEQKERDVQEKIQQQQRQKEELRRKKIEMTNLITEEPLSTDVNVVQVVIKLPSGTRLERRFNKSDSLKNLYYYIFCHDEAPDQFQVVTNFPRRVLPVEPTPEMPEPPSFEEIGLGRKEMLFVQDMDA